MTLWFFTPVVVMLFSKVPLVNHYFISLLPALFILFGIGVDAAVTALGNRHRLLSYLFYGLVAVLAAYQTVCVMDFNHLVKTHRNIQWMDYGPPLKYRVEEIGRLLTDGDVTAENIQKKLLARKTSEEAFKYDFLATEYIAENLDFPSGNPLLEINRGNRFYKQGNVEAALRCYSRAILINPACSLAYDNRGFALMSKGDLDRAIADFSEALKINPEYSNARLNRATAYSRQNDREKARQDAQRLQDSGYKVDPHLLEAIKR